MVRSTLRRTLVAFTLAALIALLVPASSVARPSVPAKGASASELSLERGLGILWELLANLRAKSGPDIDPNGASATPPTTGDEGPDIDPDGATAPADGDVGPNLDPDGAR